MIVPAGRGDERQGHVVRGGGEAAVRDDEKEANAASETEVPRIEAKVPISARSNHNIVRGGGEAAGHDDEKDANEAMTETEGSED